MRHPFCLTDVRENQPYDLWDLRNNQISLYFKFRNFLLQFCMHNTHFNFKNLWTYHDFVNMLNSSKIFNWLKLFPDMLLKTIFSCISKNEFILIFSICCKSTDQMSANEFNLFLLKMKGEYLKYYYSLNKFLSYTVKNMIAQ